MGKFLQFLEIYKPRAIATGEQDFVDTHKVEKKDYPVKNKDDLPFKGGKEKFKNRADKEPIKEAQETPAYKTDVLAVNKEKVLQAVKHLSNTSKKHADKVDTYGKSLSGYHTHNEIAKHANISALEARKHLDKLRYDKKVVNVSHDPGKGPWQTYYKAV